MPHGSISKPIFVTSLKETGGTNNLAKGQLSFVIDKAGKDGAIAVADFAGMTKAEKIKIKVGRGAIPQGLRAQHAASYGSDYFPLSSIVGIKAFAPTKVSLDVDKFEIGYDGLDALSALNIPEEKSAVMDIQIYGEPVEIMFGQKSHSIQLRVYRAKGEVMQTVIQRLVKELKSYAVPTTMPGAYAGVNDNLSNYLKIGIVDSTNVPLAGTTWTISSIQVKDAGESNDLAKVQAKYTDFKVTRSDRKGLLSTYSILHPTATVLPAYVEVEVAVEYKDCAACVVGYSQITGGVVYHVSLEDDGVDLKATVQALPNAVALSATKFGNKDGRGTYSVVLTAALDQTQTTTFLTANPTAEVKKIGITDTICSKSTSTSFTWVDGSTCNASTKNFTIVLKDDNCGTTRLAELQAAYPELVITELAGATNVGGCKRTYQTTVVTNIVCAECSDIYLQPFIAEAPVEYQANFWKSADVAPNAAALMGFTVEGKPFNLYPENYERDTIPFIQTSTKIRSVAFGYRENDYLNFVPAYDAATELAQVRHTQFAQDVNNLSQSMFGAEEVSRIHYLGEQRVKGNLFARANMSEASLLEYNKRMIQYLISYQDTSLSQSYGSRSNITHTINLVVKEGQHTLIEALINKLAAKVGLPTVNPTAD
jgi:hypothetical protein